MTLHTAIQDKPAQQSPPREGVIFLPERTGADETKNHMLPIVAQYLPDGGRICCVIDPHRSRNTLERIYGQVRTVAGRWQLMMGVPCPFDQSVDGEKHIFPAGKFQMGGADNAVITCPPNAPEMDIGKFDWVEKLFMPGAVDEAGYKHLQARWDAYCNEYGHDPQDRQVFWRMLEEDIKQSGMGGIRLETLLHGEQKPSCQEECAVAP